MIKLIYTILILAFAGFANSQWQTDVRLTNDGAASNTSLNHSRCVATSGNYVHVVWYDHRDGNDEIYYKRSTDEGVTWGPDVRLTNDAAVSAYPCIAVSGSDVRVAWQDNRSDSRYEIYYKRSTDNGATWGVDIRVTNNTAESRYPTIAVSGTTTHLVWANWRGTQLEIFYKKSLDGTNWGADTQLSDLDTTVSNTPSISVNNLGVHVVWVDERFGNKEIYYKRSVNGGISWGPDTRLTNNSFVSQKPCIAYSPQGEVHVVWVDNRDGNYEIYYKGSLDGGANWGADTRLTNNGSSSLQPSVGVSDSSHGKVHVVWQDYLGGSNEIFYKRSTDLGLNWDNEIRLTNAAGASENPFVCGFSSGGAHVVWQDFRDGNYEIYYKRNPTSVGIKNLSSEIPAKYSLSQNYPNPFNSTSKFKFEIAKFGDVKILVYDITGREVQILVNERLQPGTYETTFDGSALNSGVYFYQLIAGDFKKTRKFILLK